MAKIFLSICPEQQNSLIMRVTQPGFGMHILTQEQACVLKQICPLPQLPRTATLHLNM